MWMVLSGSVVDWLTHRKVEIENDMVKEAELILYPRISGGKGVAVMVVN